MALSKEDLYVGKLVYKLEINNNTIRRKKLSMVDADGNEWHRYDRDTWTFKVSAMNICGSIKQVVKGTVNSDSVSEDEYHLSYSYVDQGCGVIEAYDETQLIDENRGNWTQFFPWIEGAEQAGESICNERNTY